MIFTVDRNGPCTFPRLQRQRARVRLPGRDLISCDVREQSRVGAQPAAARKTYEILTRWRPIRNRKLTRVGAKNRSSKESIMLDVAFVVLGLAVLALMGVYAVGLRQL